MKNIFAFLICILLPFTILGQESKGVRPSWVDGYYLDKTNSYIEVVSATDENPELARNKAIEQIIANRSRATGLRVSISESNGNISITSQDELTIKCRVLSEYSEKIGMNRYKVSLLVQTAKNPSLPYEPVTITDKYPASARVLIPGLAQMHKGSTQKGLLFIAGQAATIGGVISCEMLRQSYEMKINQSLSSSSNRRYMDAANNMQNLRNGFIAGSIAIYVWNIIDGLVATGKQHIEVGDVYFAASLITTPQMNGASITINF